MDICLFSSEISEADWVVFVGFDLWVAFGVDFLEFFAFLWVDFFCDFLDFLSVFLWEFFLWEDFLGEEVSWTVSFCLVASGAMFSWADFSISLFSWEDFSEDNFSVAEFSRTGFFKVKFFWSCWVDSFWAVFS